MSDNDITQDIFTVVLARPAITNADEETALVHVWWSAPQQGDRLVQVYVDGELTDASIDVQQRDLWLMCDRKRPHRIELLAVPADRPDLLWQAMPRRLSSWTPPVQGEVELALVRDARLPVDARVLAVVDDTALDSGPLWPASEHRGGFGALFGLGSFGFDDATGPGLGRGELGAGTLGSDGTAWRWRRSDLPSALHDIQLSAVDDTGQPVAQPITMDDYAIESLPAPATTFAIESDFTLTWTV